MLPSPHSPAHQSASVPHSRTLAPRRLLHSQTSAAAGTAGAVVPVQAMELQQMSVNAPVSIDDIEISGPFGSQQRKVAEPEPASLGPAPQPQSMLALDWDSSSRGPTCSLCHCRPVALDTTHCLHCGTLHELWAPSPAAEAVSFTNTLDAASKLVYDAPKSLYTSAQTMAALQEAGAQVVSLCASREEEMERGPHDQLTLEQTVRAVLTGDEKLHASFATTSFQFISKTTDALPNTVYDEPGLLLLTDQRLICLTHSRTIRSALTYGPGADQTSLKGAYALSHARADRTWVFPIPLSNVKHLWLESRAAIDARAHVTARLIPCCDGCCEPCGGCPPAPNGDCSCCEDDVLVTASEARESAMQHTHAMHIGLLLPPWDTQHELLVKIHPNVAHLTMHQFTTCLHSLQQRK